MIPGRLRALVGLLRQRRVEVEGLTLVVPAGVLDPVLFRVGAWFARAVAREVRPGERLLDLGCGSGVVGALAARAGAQVTATDLDPRAVAAARSNGIADARAGDLFAPVATERFDRICFNPPFFEGHGRARPFGRALYGGPGLALVRRFAAEVEAHLSPRGVALVAWSERAAPAAALLGPGWSLARAERVEGERLELWSLAPRQEPSWMRSPG